MEDNSLMQQRKFEILLEMQSKKYEAEINSLKQAISSIAGEINSIKGQVSRMQFAPQQMQSPQRVLIEQPQQFQQQESPVKKVEIVDCRPQNERKEEFVSSSAKNAEPIRPRFGDYTSQDVSIEKFFYYGNKR